MASESRRPARNGRSAEQVQRAPAKAALAEWLHQPRSIDEIREFLERHFARPVTRRTAERYRDWMIDGYGATVARTAEGRKGWLVARAPGAAQESAPQMAESEWLQCRRAVEWLEQHGHPGWAQSLRGLMADLQPVADAEPIVDVEAAVVAPTIRIRVPAWVEAAVHRSMQRGRALSVRYRMTKQSGRDEQHGLQIEAVIHPYGVVYGERPFVIAGFDRDGRLARHASGERQLGWYALDRIERVALTEQPLLGRGDFSLPRYVQRWFGTPRGDEEPFDVCWKFSPRAAARARLYQFHPTQRLEPQDDGALIVRFYAAGSLEMSRQLVQWGEDVSVLEPDPARFAAMVAEQAEQWKTYFE